MLHTAYYFSRRDLVLALAVLYVTYGAALALFVAPGLRMNFYVGGIASLTLVGILVRLLRERLDRLVAELRQTASTDPLTGLLNRCAFANALNLELERARRSRSAPARGGLRPRSLGRAG